MTRKSAKPSNDPTFPKSPVELDGVTYNLCFDSRALADAEEALLREGRDVNILRDLPVLNLNCLMRTFPCAVRTYHPELTFEQAQSLVTMQSMFAIRDAIWAAWRNAVPALDKGEEASEKSEKSDPIEA